MNTTGWNRREFLGSLALLPAALQVPPRAAAQPRALILIWLDGGMSHLDTFDCKPEATPDIRGDLRSTRTEVDGVFVSEHLPRIAARIARCTLVRSVTHGEGNHDRGSHLLLTGHRPSAVLVHPPIGALLAGSEQIVPPYVAIPRAPDYGRHGFLPATQGPFEVGGDPGRPDFSVHDLAPAAERAAAHDLLAALAELDETPRDRAELLRDEFHARARALSLDPAARRWFALEAEPAELRARYGRHRLGQSCLLARRLIEGGTRCVLVHDPGWDHHVQIRSALTYGFPPKLTALDEAFSALVDDLRARGLDERVVVCVASEFGRTPRLNPSAGRDHWPRAQSVLLYGAGLRPGVVGSTDERGEEPAEHAVGPSDVVATLWHALGGDPELILHTADGRPVRVLAPDAHPIEEALGA